jgi:hypothetical protein
MLDYGRNEETIFLDFSPVLPDPDIFRNKKMWKGTIIYFLFSDANKIACFSILNSSAYHGY